MYVLSKFVVLGAVVLERMVVAMGIGKKTEVATVTGRRVGLVMVIGRTEAAKVIREETEAVTETGRRAGVVMIESDLTGKKIKPFFLVGTFYCTIHSIATH